MLDASAASPPPSSSAARSRRTPSRASRTTEDDHLHRLQRAGRPRDRRPADDHAAARRDVRRAPRALPDQSGQNLAWSLGTIDGFDRASVTLTVTPADADPARSSTPGAQAFATLDAGAVSAATPAATLRAGHRRPRACSPRRPTPTPPTRSSRKRRRSSATTRSRSSTSCTPRSATTPTSARSAVRAARSGPAPATPSTSPAWAWP